jgi:two-component system cell cycle response regulator DivK
MAHRILVVEDDKDSRELLVDALRYHGFEALEAGDGQEALDCMLSEQPDLVVLDMSLPVKSGWDVAVEARESPAGRIPIIALTGYGSERGGEEMAESGCAAWLRKPCRPRDLIAEIERVLGIEDSAEPR